ncbi:DUF1697 domain-containing protein [Halobacillus sp. Marseille-Q1614]|uniref:DUF1697 domain-containing protein n=1 Tax=Halobacillus sp. Marseille-Q1614 TaxID=2709134 RepID=UPI00156F83AB|nr:DUF1697 domain-containing protein [Halobacillus sp. Marseille-Q1614]
MIYAALLRGINVGGKNKVDMKLLKKTFERIGMEAVVTYINSGNIIFKDHQYTQKELPAIIEQAIQKDFNLSIKVVVRSLTEFEKLMEALPDSWTNDKEMKSDVMFLWDEINDETVLNHLVIKPEIDTVKYVSGAILWSLAKKDVNRSGMKKLVGSKIYKKVTVRNVNTTRKIYELMSKSTS